MANDIKKFLDKQGVTTLWTRITAELGQRQAATEAKITAETQRATAIESGLANDITAETNRAKSVESGFDTRITTAQDDATTAKQKAEANAALIGTLPEGSSVSTIVAYVDKKTEGIASDEALTSLTGRVDTAEGKITTIESDYLKAADKAELQGTITTAQETADQVNTDLIAEIARAKEAEKANADAITLLTDGAGTAEIDSVKELIQYTKDHGTEVTGMQADIAANAKAIETLNGTAETAESVANKIKAQADADAKVYATKTEVTEKESGLSGRLDALEKIDHEHKNLALLETYTQTEANLADAVAKKHEHANATVLNGITQENVTAWSAAEQNAKTYADTEVYQKIIALTTQDIDEAIAAVTTKPTP